MVKRTGRKGESGLSLLNYDEKRGDAVRHSRSPVYDGEKDEEKGWSHCDDSSSAGTVGDK